jgi:hypothetical protein
MVETTQRESQAAAASSDREAAQPRLLGLRPRTLAMLFVLLAGFASQAVGDTVPAWKPGFGILVWGCVWVVLYFLAGREHVGFARWMLTFGLVCVAFEVAMPGIVRWLKAWIPMPLAYSLASFIAMFAASLALWGVARLGARGLTRSSVLVWMLCVLAFAVFVGISAWANPNFDDLDGPTHLATAPN